MSEQFFDLFIKLLPLHEKRIQERLTQVKIDLDEFLDYTQARLNLALENQIWNSHLRDLSQGSGFFDNTQLINDTKKIQNVVVKMLENSSTNGEYTIAQFANALKVKGITISVKGVGIVDGINYNEKFGLKPGRALYNRLNDLTRGSRDSSKLMSVVKEIIKKYSI